ncbi:MAG: toll/interleukin-1 receptor domain-containing protein [Verrucomicrobiota bacterium]
MSTLPPTQYRIGAFISYSTDDSEAAFTICEKLESMGRTCWIAERDVRAGRDYGEEIINAIDDAACVVLVFSAASNASAFVKREIERAASKNKPILAVMIEKVKPSPGIELFISSVQWVNATDGRLAFHMENLSEEIGNLQSATNEARTGRENYQKMRREKKRRALLRNVFLFVVIAAALCAAVVTLITRYRVESIPPVSGVVSPQQDTKTPPAAEVPEKPPEPPVTPMTPPATPVPLPRVTEPSVSAIIRDRKIELRGLIDGGRPEDALARLIETITEFPPAQQWRELVELDVQALKNKLLVTGLIDPPKVAEGLRRLADQENEMFPEAIELYGMAVLNGIGVEKDPEAGFELLTKAARHDRAPARYALGVCYMNGEGTEKNSKLASSSFERALEIEGWSEAHSRAANAYAVLNHQQGKGITPQNEKVYQYVTLATGHGSLPAKAKQAIMLINGDGVAREVMEGFHLLEQASAAGDRTAILLLADVLDQAPEPVKKDPARARKLRELAKPAE